MATTRFRGRTRSRSGRSARRMEWIGASTNTTLSPAAGTVIAAYLVLPSEVRALTDPTLVRTRMSVIVTQVAAGATHAAWGLIAWDDQNDTVPTDPPLPLGSPSMDWILHDWILTTGTGILQYNWSPGFTGLMADSRAMRRLGQSRGLLFCLENGATSSGIINCRFGGRCLLKE